MMQRWREEQLRPPARLWCSPGGGGLETSRIALGLGIYGVGASGLTITISVALIALVMTPGTVSPVAGSVVLHTCLLFSLAVYPRKFPVIFAGMQALDGIVESLMLLMMPLAASEMYVKTIIHGDMSHQQVAFIICPLIGALHVLAPLPARTKLAVSVCFVLNYVVVMPGVIALLHGFEMSAAFAWSTASVVAMPYTLGACIVALGLGSAEHGTASGSLTAAKDIETPAVIEVATLEPAALEAALEGSFTATTATDGDAAMSRSQGQQQLRADAAGAAVAVNLAEGVVNLTEDTSPSNTDSSSGWGCSASPSYSSEGDDDLAEGEDHL